MVEQVFFISEGNECVLGRYVLEADEIKEDVPHDVYVGGSSDE